jgi:hypothetical protein
MCWLTLAGSGAYHSLIMPETHNSHLESEWIS